MAFADWLAASIGGTPLPVFCRLNEIDSHRIPFDVSQHRQQVSVGLDWKRFETPLIQVPGPAGFVVSMPAHRVHHCQPPEELAHRITGFRPGRLRSLTRQRHVRVPCQRFGDALSAIYLRNL